jgi:hypothetical protein
MKHHMVESLEPVPFRDVIRGGLFRLHGQPPYVLMKTDKEGWAVTLSGSVLEVKADAKCVLMTEVEPTVVRDIYRHEAK